MNIHRLLCVADHLGPFQALSAVFAQRPPKSLRWLLGPAARQTAHSLGIDSVAVKSSLRPMHYLKSHHVTALVRGTSQDRAKRDLLEDMWGSAATKLGLPIFVIEDFPFNYRWRPEEKPSVVFVESADVAREHQRRQPSAPVEAVGNPRYTVCRSVRPLQHPPTVLWAGQPDGKWSYRTFLSLLAPLKQFKSRLLFRAHPRDIYYREGRYRRLQKSSLWPWEDISFLPITSSLWQRVDLVVTQYSSLALEAASKGIPALFALFADSGALSMMHFKGHTSLPWCDAKAAFRVTSPERLKESLAQALFDQNARLTVISNFARICRRNKASAARIRRQIQHVLNSRRSAK